MVKKVIILSVILVLFLFLVSCAPKPSKTITEKPKETTAPIEKIATTGEAPVDAVAEGISDTGAIDKELNTSEVGDIENVLADIEKI